MLGISILFSTVLLNAKTAVIIRESTQWDNVKDVAEAVGFGALVIGAAAAVGTLIGKAVSGFYSAESYYKSAKNLYDAAVDIVVTTPCSNSFEFEQLILQRRSWINGSWNIDTSDCYLYSAYHKLLGIQSSLEKSLEYAEIAAGKSLKETNHKSNKIYKKSKKLITKIRFVLAEIPTKLQLCQYHPLYESHTKVYLKKKELKEAREHAQAVEWKMQQQIWATQEQTEAIKEQNNKVPQVDITIINK